jgi:hypothetical protein
MLPRGGAGGPRRSCDAWHTRGCPADSAHCRKCPGARAPAHPRSIDTRGSRPRSGRAVDGAKHRGRRGHRRRAKFRSRCSPPNPPAHPLTTPRRAQALTSAVRMKRLVAPLTAGPGVIGRSRSLPRTGGDFRLRCHAKRRGFAGFPGGIRDTSRRSSQPFVPRPVGAQFGASVECAGAVADHILKPALPAETRERRIADAEDGARLIAPDKSGCLGKPGHRPNLRRNQASQPRGEPMCHGNKPRREPATIHISAVLIGSPLANRAARRCPPG